MLGEGRARGGRMLGEGRAGGGVSSTMGVLAGQDIVAKEAISMIPWTEGGESKQYLAQ